MELSVTFSKLQEYFRSLHFHRRVECPHSPDLRRVLRYRFGIFVAKFRRRGSVLLSLLKL